VVYGAGAGISFRDETFRGSDNLNYYRGTVFLEKIFLSMKFEALCLLSKLLV
jgi:hypothetical protein